MIGNDIFDELFVLELANNHLGDLQRGLKIIGDYSQMVRFNNVRAAIKLQLRDIDTFIHKDFRQRETTSATLRRPRYSSNADRFRRSVQAIRQASCIPWQRRLTRARSTSAASWAFQSQDRQFGLQRLDSDRENRQDQETGYCLHRRVFTQRYRRLSHIFRQSPHSFGDQSLRLDLSIGRLRYRAEPDRLSEKPVPKPYHWFVHSRVS